MQGIRSVHKHNPENTVKQEQENKDIKVHSNDPIL